MSYSPNASTQRPRSWWLWVGFWTVLFVIMHVPPSELPSNLGGADKLAHFVSYLILASLGAYRLCQSRGGSIVTALMGWAVVYFAYAALDEWLQRFVRRTPSYSDWLADVAGVVVATGMAITWARRSGDKLSEPAGRATGDNVTRS